MAEADGPEALSRAPRRRGVLLLHVAGCALLGSLGCSGGGAGGGGGDDVPSLDAEALQDPEACASCHPDHFREWSGSMHAYASDDPVFIAMNARAQRETGGALGSFCVDCHAPMAVRTGATQDGLNLDALPRSLRGVTCYFCHSVVDVGEGHNNGLILADDGILRGSMRNPDPVPTGAHRTEFSSRFEHLSGLSPAMCGSCHDVVAPPGGAVERTFAEWRGSMFAHDKHARSCNACHMEPRDGRAATTPGAPERPVHAHTFAGVDTALTPFPEAEVQREAVQRSLDGTLQGQLCVTGAGSPGATLQVVLENVSAGHMWPSGAAHDRRAWVEVIAYAGGQPVYQSGVIAGGESVTASLDPDLWLIRECLFDAQGQYVSMLWEAASHESNQLPVPTPSEPSDPAHGLARVVRTFPRPTSTPAALAVPPDRVTMRVRLVPVGFDVLDDLIAGGDLDPLVRGRIPTLDLGGVALEWTAETATHTYDDGGTPVSCVSSGISTPPSEASPAPENASCAP